MKSSDINIMDKQSVGSTITKKNIEDIFVVTKLKEIKLNNEEIKDVAEEKQEIKEEQPKEETKNEEENKDEESKEEVKEDKPKKNKKDKKEKKK